MEDKRNIFYYIITGLIIVLGIFLRTKFFLLNNIFSDDECRLALSMMNKSLLDSMFFLGDAQSAPPIFVLISKIITNMFGFTEHAAKFISYAAGVSGVYLFFKVCKKYLISRIGVVAGMIIFAICQPLIAFSASFKQYSSDVLIALICLYYLPQIRIAELNKRELCILGVSIILLPLISLPSLFFISAFFISNLRVNWKRIFALFLPFIIVMLGYYTFILVPARADLNNYFPDYWTDGFFSLSLTSFIKLIIINIKFYFVPNDLSLPAIILFISGIVCFLREKTSQGKFILLTFLSVLIASFLRIYPLSSRVGLYILPVFLIFILKPLDVKNKVVLPVVILLLLFSFCRYDFNYLKNITTFDYFVSYSPKNLMLEMKNKFKPNTDIVLCNSASTPSYLFYSVQNNFYPENVYEMPLNYKDRAGVFEYLNNLNSGKNYWFYLVKDYRRAKVFPIILEWLEKENVKHYYRERDSYLYYVEK